MATGGSEPTGRPTTDLPTMGMSRALSSSSRVREVPEPRPEGTSPKRGALPRNYFDDTYDWIVPSAARRTSRDPRKSHER
jgi:hypothetical protein